MTRPLPNHAPALLALREKIEAGLDAPADKPRVRASSEYLNRPLRTLEQARADMEARRRKAGASAERGGMAERSNAPAGLRGSNPSAATHQSASIECALAGLCELLLTYDVLMAALLLAESCAP